MIIPEYIDFAISSLETDEAYQLEYENPTNGDMIKALFPEGISKDIVWTLQSDKGVDWWNAPYKRGTE